MTRAEIENLNAAQQLISAGLRLTIVQHLTGVKTNVARDLWHEIHGKKPSTGKLPETSLCFMVTSSAACRVSAFAVFYSHFSNQNYNISSSRLIAAYGEFNKIIPGFDINAAYRVVTDLFIGFMTFKRCKECSASFVYSDHSKSSKCPFCVKKV